MSNYMEIREGETLESASARLQRYYTAKSVVESSTIEVEQAPTTEFRDAGVTLTVNMNVHQSQVVHLNAIQAHELMTRLIEMEGFLKTEMFAIGNKADAAYIENGFADGAWS